MATRYVQQSETNPFGYLLGLLIGNNLQNKMSKGALNEARSEWDQDQLNDSMGDVSDLQNRILSAKQLWKTASDNQDSTGMSQAHSDADYFRRQLAYKAPKYSSGFGVNDDYNTSKSKFDTTMGEFNTKSPKFKNYISRRLGLFE